MEQMASAKLPPAWATNGPAISYQEKKVGGEALLIFALAVLLVYLVLAAQYESWTNPAAVVLVVPLALLGTVMAVAVRGMDNNVYTQIGVVLLIALASKNAILIVEFAREQRAAGKSIVEAAVEAARLRFRPILMTSFAFILGVYPAGRRRRRRRGQPARARHGRVRRHDHVDFPRRALRARLLRGLPELERAARCAASEQACFAARASRVVSHGLRPASLRPDHRRKSGRRALVG